jgi:hypothetical protein
MKDTTMKIRVQSLYWNRIEPPVQSIKCYYASWEREGKEYAVSGFFGCSAGYKDWTTAMNDIARRHGFSYSIID